MQLKGGKAQSAADARTCGVSDRVEVIEDMIEIGWEQGVYPAPKIAHVGDALSAEGVAPLDALRGTDITIDQMRSPSILVSVNQVVECYRNAIRLARDPHFAFQTGLKTHVSLYGMYGFAILSS